MSIYCNLNYINTIVYIASEYNTIVYIASDLQLGKLKENILATQAFANPENISEPQTGIKLPRLRWQRESCDMSWFISDIHTPNSAVSICLYISNIKHISSMFNILPSESW